MAKCKNCGEKTKDNNKFCSYRCRNITNNKKLDYSKVSNTLKTKYVDEYNKNKKYCKFCNCELSYEKRKNVFCDSVCFAKYHNNELKKRSDYKEFLEKKNLKIKNTMTGRGHDDVELECKFCGESFTIKYAKRKQKFCSRSCASKYRMSLPENIEFMREVGRKSAQKQAETRRSKNEIYFAKLCEKHFKGVRTNEAIFNGWDADVIIDDIKVAVLWNGKWHYEKITEKHSVKQVQNRDKIKIKEIKEFGYAPYIIKDMGRENKEFVEEKFKEFMKFLYIVYVFKI